MHAVGTLQTCAGLESGIEAAIHVVRKSFEEDSSEYLLLVDADNHAFNKLNRKVSLENIKRKDCAPHVHIPTQQLQHTRHALVYLENGDHILTVTGGCNARGQCSYDNVYALST